VDLVGVPVADRPVDRIAAPEPYTPKHLAEKILTSRSALEGERKQVTVLFADLKGSLELLADRDPEEARKLLDPVLERTMEAVHRYEGTVNRVMGDGIMALFGALLAHEDHAVRACYAAIDLQRAMRRLTEELRQSRGVTVQARLGLNSGEVVVRAISNDLHMDYTAAGQTTHLAARMEQLASPGPTLLTAETMKVATRAGAVAQRPGEPFRLVEEVPDARPIAELEERVPDVEMDVDGQLGRLPGLGETAERLKRLLQVDDGLPVGGPRRGPEPRLTEIGDRLVPQLPTERVMGQPLGLLGEALGRVSSSGSSRLADA
jgi:class 3 adenylate cyclase